MDNDDIRRGKPSNHVVFGESLAVLAGDALLTSAIHIIASETKGVSSDTVLNCIIKLCRGIGLEGIVGGQARDLYRGDKPLSMPELKQIHRMKTGSLLQVSAGIGAMLAGAGKDDIERVEGFARDIGLAFQIQDDLQDAWNTSLSKSHGEVQTANYLSLVGSDEARLEVQRLLKGAHETLSIYKEKAIPLLSLANFILESAS